MKPVAKPDPGAQTDQSKPDAGVTPLFWVPPMRAMWASEKVWPPIVPFAVNAKRPAVPFKTGLLTPEAAAWCWATIGKEGKGRRAKMNRSFEIQAFCERRGQFGARRRSMVILAIMKNVMRRQKAAEEGASGHRGRCRNKKMRAKSISSTGVVKGECIQSKEVRKGFLQQLGW